MSPNNDKPVILTQAQLTALLEQAAESGARKALSAVGLHDDKAARDVIDLRSLLEAFRSAKNTVWTTIIRVGTVAALAFIGAAVWSRQ
jgi:2-iminoacetate synthase ThiH